MKSDLEYTITTRNEVYNYIFQHILQYIDFYLGHQKLNKYCKKYLASKEKEYANELFHTVFKSNNPKNVFNNLEDYNKYIVLTTLIENIKKVRPFRLDWQKYGQIRSLEDVKNLLILFKLRTNLS